MIDQSVHFTFVPGNYGSYGRRPGTVTLSGYVCGFEEEERYGGPAEGGWVERIERSAFARAVATNPDVGLLQNFEGMPMARARNGTLSLSVDDVGLHVHAVVQADDPAMSRILNYHRLRDDAVAEGVFSDVLWGFSYRVKAQEWSSTKPVGNWSDGSGEFSYRVITELALDRGDISITTVPAEVTVGG